MSTGLPLVARSYDHKLIAFFDILGWRHAIVRAGNDATAIAHLGLITDMFSAAFLSDDARDEGTQLSSFSDNVAVSFSTDPDAIPIRLRALATIQIGAAMLGFWLRGAVTIGDIYHSSTSVFGPGLVRAHHLESTQAIVPRILIDPEITASANFSGAPVVMEQGRTFLDPFTPTFIDQAAQQSVGTADFEAFNDTFGSSLGAPPSLPNGLASLSHLQSRISSEIGRTSEPRVWTKLAWVFDRIAPRVGSSATAAMLPSLVDERAVFVETEIF